MKQTITKIAPLQLGKIAGAVYALMSLIFIPVVVIIAVIAVFFDRSEGAPSPAITIVFALGAMVVAPIFYGAMGFISGVVVAWGYNLIAKWIGGIQIELS